MNKELKVKTSLSSMPSNNLITEANRMAFTEKALEGFKMKVASYILEEPTIEPMWEDYCEEEGFMPKSKSNRAKRMGQKKARDHKGWQLKELDKEMDNLFANDSCAYRSELSQHRKELEPIWRRVTKALDEPYEPSRQKSGNKLLMDYYESVAGEEAELMASERLLTKTRTAIKEAKQMVASAKNMEAFYRTKAEEINTELESLMVLAEELEAICYDI